MVNSDSMSLLSVDGLQSLPFASLSAHLAHLPVHHNLLHLQESDIYLLH